MWTLLLWFCATFLLIYISYGPYIFASVCGAYYMQHNFNLSTEIAHPESIKTTASPFPSTLSPTTLNPFLIYSGSCTQSYTVSHNRNLHCVQSPNYPFDYPSDRSCRIGIKKFYAGDSLTAIDFATRVGDTLKITWEDIYECGNEGITSSLGDAKYVPDETDDYLDYGYRNFSGLVGGPCNFTCDRYSAYSFSLPLRIDWKPVARAESTNSASQSNNSARGWKLCYEPAKIRGVVADFQLQCTAPATVCAPEFYIAYLWVTYIGVIFLFLFSLFVCYCGVTVGACLDACCWLGCGVTRCCYDVSYNACLRADVVARGRENEINARVSARYVRYEKVCASCHRNQDLRTVC